MKKCLPTSTKVSKDAKECVQECTSEFISFITSEVSVDLVTAVPGYRCWEHRG